MPSTSGEAASKHGRGGALLDRLAALDRRAQTAGVLLQSGGDGTGMGRVGDDSVVTPAFGDADGQQHIGGLGLPVCAPRIVGSETVVDVVEHHRRQQMSTGTDRHHPCATRCAECVMQSEGESEMADEVRRELHFMAVRRSRQFGQRHDTGIVDQHMHRLDAEAGDEVPDGRQVGDVELRGGDGGIAGGLGDGGGDPAPGVDPADPEDDIGPCGREGACGLHADAGRGTGDDGAPSGQVHVGKNFRCRRGEPERCCKQTCFSHVRHSEAVIAATTSSVYTTPWARKA